MSERDSLFGLVSGLCETEGGGERRRVEEKDREKGQEKETDREKEGEREK